MGLLQQLLGIPDNNGDLLSRALSLNDVRPSQASWFAPGELDPAAFGMPQQAQREPGAVMARAPVQQVAMPAAVSDTQAPIGTTLPASSQAAAAQPRPEAAAAPASPAMPQMAGPSMGDRLQAFLMAGSDGSLARGVGSAMGLDRQRETENLTVRALMARGGYSQQDATAIARNPAMLQQVLPSLFGPKNPTKLGPGEVLVGQKGETIARNDGAKPQFHTLAPGAMVVGPDGTVIARNDESAPKVHSVAPGAMIVDGGGRVLARNDEVKPQFHNVAPGGALVGPDGKLVYQADPKQDAPAGYEWVDKADKSKGMVAIAGGPGTKMAGESYGKLALMDVAKQAIEKSKSVLFQPWGISGSIQSGLANVAPGIAGDIGQAKRDLQAGIEAALRVMTGAAAPEAEVKRYMNQFEPKAMDDAKTAENKVKLLTDFMNKAEEFARQGHMTRDDLAAQAKKKQNTADPLGIR